MPWGWGGVSFGWRNHTIIVNNRPWERTWVNRDRAAIRMQVRQGRELLGLRLGWSGMSCASTGLRSVEETAEETEGGSVGS